MDKNTLLNGKGTLTLIILRNLTLTYRTVSNYLKNIRKTKKLNNNYNK